MIKKLFANKQPKKHAIYMRLINSWEWQKLRRKKFLANPICEDCLAKGRVTPTEEIHHVRPVESGRDEIEMKQLAYDYNNLVSLCKTCHAARHAPPIPDDDRGERTKAFAKKFFGIGG